MTKPNTQTTALAQRPAAPSPAQTEPMQLVERLAKDYSLLVLKDKGHFERAIILSRGIRELRKAVEPFMGDIMALMNDPLGFLTDRDPKRSGKDNRSITPYTQDVVRDCLIQALLKGLYPVGNEFNIISGKQYTTKEGFERLVREYPGVTDLDVSQGVPRMGNSGAVVPVRASWRLDGKPMFLKNERGAPLVEIPVRLNAGMGVDAALGKADRKVYARIYKKITGTDHAEGDVGDLDFPTLSVEEAGRLLEQARERERSNGSGASGEQRPPRRTEAALPPANGDSAAAATPKADAEQLARLRGLVAELRWEEGEFLAYVANYGKERPENLTRGEAEELLAELLDQLRQQKEAAEETP